MQVHTINCLVYADTLIIRVLIKFSSYFHNQTDSRALILISLPKLRSDLNGAQHEPCRWKVFEDKDS